MKSERAIFGLNTSIMAVAEGNFGRLGTNQQQVYTTGNARIQLDPTVWETPGAMPEIAPSPDSPANIGRPFYDRSMALQAWGAYGILWPVIHQQLGVDPDLGHGRVAVIPQLPQGQQKVAGSNIRVGRGSVDVSARLTGKELRTDVTVKGVGATVTIGAVLPTGAKVKSVYPRRPGRAVQAGHDDARSGGAGAGARCVLGTEDHARLRPRGRGRYGTTPGSPAGAQPFCAPAGFLLPGPAVIDTCRCRYRTQVSGTTRGGAPPSMSRRGPAS